MLLEWLSLNKQQKLSQKFLKKRRILEWVVWGGMGGGMGGGIF